MMILMVIDGPDEKQALDELISNCEYDNLRVTIAILMPSEPVGKDEPVQLSLPFEVN
jgi:hypothetical protein